MQNEVAKLTVSVKEASAMIGVSSRTLWQIVKDGKLAVCRIGTRVLFPVAELERFIRESTAVETQA
jgi:excisionase family DNA binding protein